jgi:hypothetical protein
MCDSEFAAAQIEWQIVRLSPSTAFDREIPKRPHYAPFIAAGFIFVNSASGLMGQLQKFQGDSAALWAFWLLPLGVLVGGWIGSRCGCGLLPALRVRQITGGIILLVAGNLWTKIL